MYQSVDIRNYVQICEIYKKKLRLFCNMGIMIGYEFRILYNYLI